MALMDVQEIANASFDDTWHTLAKNMNLWEDSLIKLNKLIPKFKLFKRKLYKLGDVAIVIYPNTSQGKNFALPNECVIDEKSIRKEVKRICVERLEVEEEENLKQLEVISLQKRKRETCL